MRNEVLELLYCKIVLYGEVENRHSPQIVKKKKKKKDILVKNLYFL